MEVELELEAEVEVEVIEYNKTFCFLQLGEGCSTSNFTSTSASTIAGLQGGSDLMMQVEVLLHYSVT